MLKTSIMIVSASALALAACGQNTETTATTTNDTAAFDASNAGIEATRAETNATTTAATVTGGQAFANTAAASDAFEIETSKLALATSGSAAIKTYANQMIAAHTKSTDKLKATASGLTPAIAPDPTLSAEQQATLATLKAKTGADFDAAYVATQRDAHQQTLDALKSYAATGDVPALKTFATDLVPTVTAHLNMAKGLKG